MRRPARLSLCIATALATTMMIIGGARGGSRDLFLGTKSAKDYEHGTALRMFLENMVRVMDNGKNWRPRHATILSRFVKDFEDATPLCENYSCFKGDRLDRFVDVRGFSQANLVVVFNHNLNSDLNGIQSCRRCRILVVTRKPVSRKSLTAYYNRQEAKKVLFLSFVVVDGPTIRYYGPKSTGDCEIEAKLIMKWKAGDVWPKVAAYFNSPTEILRGCTMAVKTTNEMPAMRVEDVGGTMTITGGVEGDALLVAAKVLKMNVQVETINAHETSITHVPLEQQFVNDVASGKVDIGIGQLRLSSRLNTSSVDFSGTQRFETVVWCVPRIIKYPVNIMTFEFSRLTWMLIFFIGVVMICISCIFRGVSRKNLEIETQRRNRRDVLITRETLRNRRKLAIRKKPKGLGKMILDVFSMSLGYPVFVDPVTTSARILLFTFLYYVMVITTGYKASLSSAMAVGIEKPSITDVNGIIAANLTTGGGIAELEVLMDQVDASLANRELIRRYVVYHNHTEAMNRIKSRRDFAYLTLLSHLYHQEGVETVKDNPNYYVLPDPVLTYSSMIISEKRSAIRVPLTRTIFKLYESGIIDYWQTLARHAKHHRPNSNDRDDKEPRRKRANFIKFAPIFFTYAICMLVSLLVFLAELLVHKFW